jgi:DNA-directed RNA polymerase subunit M/transcription elongation factor TFIIS
VIRFSCPDCERVLEVPDDDAGLAMTCPTCGRRVQVPGAVPAEPKARAESAAARPRLSAVAAPDEGMAAIEDCPGCGKALQVPQEQVGRRVACPRCGHQFVARAPAKVGTAGSGDEDDQAPRRRRYQDDDDERPRRRKRRSAARVCDECGADLDDDGSCPECDERPGRRLSARQRREAHSKKTAAGICGILLGGFGVHKFVLGFTTPGVIMLLVSLLTFCIAFKIMWIIGIVEGITYLTKSDEEFYQTYMVGKKEWF